jgi:hypothetical protein
VLLLSRMDQTRCGVTCHNLTHFGSNCDMCTVSLTVWCGVTCHNLTHFGSNCDMCTLSLTVWCGVTCHNLTHFGSNCDMCTVALLVSVLRMLTHLWQLTICSVNYSTATVTATATIAPPLAFFLIFVLLQDFYFHN